jgi:FkbM family methyltransferase
MIVTYGQQDVTLPDDPNITGWFEDEAEVRQAHWRVRPGDVVIDIGCHIGSYTIPALAAGAMVYAVDPSVAYTGTLVRLCESNRLDVSRLVVIHEALAAPGGYEPGFRTALDTMPYPEHHAPDGAVFSTLDELAQEHDITRLDWVKIDVEGAELGVLMGGAATLRQFVPRLLIEDHTDVYPFVAQMNSRLRCHALLEGFGYRIETVLYAGHLTPDRSFWVCSPALGKESEK